MLGESLDIAEKRFGFLENKLYKKPTLSEKYKEFMTEYINLGHMSEIVDPFEISGNEIIYYMPHATRCSQ